MLYWLVDLSDKLSVLNVFRYITFRTGGAVITALLFVFLFGQYIINRLRLFQGKGQPIRTDGPKSHIAAKAGTPTMGGLMFLAGIAVGTLLWADLTDVYVWVVLLVTMAFGFLGFLDRRQVSNLFQSWRGEFPPWLMTPALKQASPSFACAGTNWVLVRRHQPVTASIFSLIFASA